MDKDWHELISQPQYKIKAERDVFVPMRDGIKLAANVFRPEAEGKFPEQIHVMCQVVEVDDRVRLMVRSCIHHSLPDCLELITCLHT